MIDISRNNTSKIKRVMIGEYDVHVTPSIPSNVTNKIAILITTFKITTMVHIPAGKCLVVFISLSPLISMFTSEFDKGHTFDD